LCDEPALVQALRLSQGQRLIVCSVCPRSRQWEWAHISPGSDVTIVWGDSGVRLGSEQDADGQSTVDPSPKNSAWKLDCDRRRAVCRGWIVVVAGDKGKMLISIYDNDAEVIWNSYQWLMQL
jgi:hypothetical protein